VNRSPLLLRLLVAAALFLALSALCLRNYYPPLAYPLTVDLVLDHRAGGGHLLDFAGTLGVGAVAGHIQARG